MMDKFTEWLRKAKKTPTPLMHGHCRMFIRLRHGKMLPVEIDNVLFKTDFSEVTFIHKAREGVSFIAIEIHGYWPHMYVFLRRVHTVETNELIIFRMSTQPEYLE